MDTDRLFVITGGPGSGKTTLIEALAAAGVATSPEVGRAIIREEVATGGTALPWADELAFAERMVVREIAAHAEALASGSTVVLDRGVPDVVGFLRVSGLPVPPHIDAAARTLSLQPPCLHRALLGRDLHRRRGTQADPGGGGSDPQPSWPKPITTMAMS